MAKILPIITEPSDILRKKSKIIDTRLVGSDDFQALCLDMAKTMKKNDGVGLAAPQIGKNIKLIVLNTKDGEIFMINPRFTKKSWKKEWGEEGCLSVPNTFGQVRRHSKVICEFINMTGEKIVLEGEGMLARVMQHEIDHLDGILFIDKAKDVHKINS